MAASKNNKHAGSTQHQPVESRPLALVGAIVILLIYQGYTLSIESV